MYIVSSNHVHLAVIGSWQVTGDVRATVITESLRTGAWFSVIAEGAGTADGRDHPPPTNRYIFVAYMIVASCGCRITM